MTGTERERTDAQATSIDPAGLEAELIVLAEGVLKRARDVHGGEPRLLFEVLNLLARLRECAGQFAQAEAIYGEALALVKQGMNFNADEIACAESNLERVRTRNQMAGPIEDELPPRTRGGSPQPAPSPSRGAVRTRKRPAELLAETARSLLRYATGRYYPRMNLHRLFPLLVVLSRDQIQKPLERAIEQAHLRGLRVGQGLPVEVEPVLPGCLCFPHHRLIAPDDDVGLARFHVLPQLSGKVTDACVLLRQGGELLGEVPLQMTVRRQWLVILLGVMTPVVPFLVKLFHLDPTEHVDEHFGSVYGLLTWLLVQLQSASWWAALLGMAAITGLTWWWWVRPRREEFYDVELLPPVAERLTRARQLLRAGQEDEGLAEIDLLRQERPDSREGSILLGMWYLENMQYRTAYDYFLKGLDGPTPTHFCQHAAQAATAAGEPEQALKWLEKALRGDTPAAVRAQIRQEQARIACGKNDSATAMKYLQDIKEGAQSRSVYQTDVALTPLHDRPDFQDFLKRMPA